MFGEDQRMESFPSSASRAEALLESFGVALGFGVGPAGDVHRGIGQTQHDSPDHSQHQSRMGCPYSTEVLLHGDIQAMVQSALDDPVVTFKSKQAPRLQLVQG